MIRLPPISTRTDTLFPYTTLFRSIHAAEIRLVVGDGAVMLAFDPSGLVLRQGRPAHCPRGAVMVVERLLLFDRLMIEITLGERVTTIGAQGRGDCHFVQRPQACLGTFGIPVLDQEQDPLGYSAGPEERRVGK